MFRTYLCFLANQVSVDIWGCLVKEHARVELWREVILLLCCIYGCPVDVPSAGNCTCTEYSVTAIPNNGPIMDLNP